MNGIEALALFWRGSCLELSGGFIHKNTETSTQ